MENERVQFLALGSREVQSRIIAAVLRVLRREITAIWSMRTPMASGRSRRSRTSRPFSR